MSLDYEFTPIDVDIISHPKAFAAGPEAMGLWLWGQAHSKLHGTDGRIARMAALAAWGGKRNIMHAKRLVTAGLWLAREDGDWDVWNHEKKAPKLSRTAGAKRTADWRDRKKSEAGDVTGDVSHVTSHEHHRDVSCDVSASTSISLSSDLSLEIASPPLPSPPPTPPPVSTTRATQLALEEPPGMTPERRGMVAQIGEPAGVTTLDAELEWISYTSHAARELKPVSTAGWKHWLCNAVKFAKRDRIRDAARGPMNRHVQSGENRAWIMPKEMP